MSSIPTLFAGELELLVTTFVSALLELVFGFLATLFGILGAIF